jgi:creatinine amidohydrolase
MDKKFENQEVWLDRLTGDLADRPEIDKAILPLGACEYHGAHLPYGTDTIAAETFATAIARELGNTVALPAVPYGVSYHHLHWRWTISLSPETLISIIRDVGHSLAQHDIRKLVLLSTHDSNPQPAHAAARLLSHEYGITSAICAGWQRRARVLLAGEWDIDPDHGGQSEMSIVLYGAPGVAKLDRAKNLPGLTPDMPVELIGKFSDDRPDGFSGNAAHGTAEEGEAVDRALTDDVVPFLRKLDEHGWQRGTWIRENS